MGRRRINKNEFVVLGVFVAVFLFTFLVQKFNGLEEVDAANMSAFDPGYIISDYQMSNYNSMSESQIQDFLWSKGRCYNTNFSGVGTRVGYFSDSTPPTTWHVINGHTVCLAEENMNGESAAHIIWQAAQDYRINPQVLIVLLQKETGMITDSIPNSWDYQRATGYGCPDTAACSSQYFGFKNQVRKAAELFRIVLDNGYSKYPVGGAYVQWSTHSECGSGWVNIKNRATSALYRYTPYQPNAAALASSYGTGDYCSQYGNRNFYSYFEDWFGNIKWDGYPTPDKLDASLGSAGNEGTDLGVQYRTNLEHYGWRGWIDGAEASGSVGYSIQVESFRIKLDEGINGGIEYRAHVSNMGWIDYVSDGAVAGMEGKDLQVEALQVRLVGEIAKRYDVYYRVHVQNTGWMQWMKNDEVAGTTGKSLQVEAIQVRIVKKDLNLGPEYSAHAQDYGWMDWKKNAKTAGTTGQAKRLEAIKIKLPADLISSTPSDIVYRVHVQDYGWMDWKKNGEQAGTTGQSKRLEAIEIKLNEELAKNYDVYYRVHVQDYGWMDWKKNGEQAGTTGQSKRLEAIQIELVKK